MIESGESFPIAKRIARGAKRTIPFALSAMLVNQTRGGTCHVVLNRFILAYSGSLAARGRNRNRMAVHSQS